MNLSLLKYILRRILEMFVVLFVIITITFFLMRIAPGSPFDQEKAMPEEVKKNIEKNYGMDKPLYIQYFSYMGNILCGDLGPSLVQHDYNVIELIGPQFMVSMQIGGISMLLAVIFGVAMGFLAALKQNTIVDYGLMSFSILGISIPNMVLGPLLAVVLGLKLGWLPVAGWGLPENYVLPIFTLTLYYMAIIARIARGSMLEVIRQEFIQTARSKGLSESTIILRHALKPALLPVVSYCGPASAFIITGSIVVEKIFNVPGIGQFFVDGATGRDYTLVMGTVILISILVMSFNLLVDITYTFLDPRIKLHEK